MKGSIRLRITALFFTFCLICISSYAEVSGINVLSILPVENIPTMYFEVRAQDSSGSGLRMQQQDFEFVAHQYDAVLNTSAVPTGSQGHIIVVDTSLYYYGNKVLKIENIQDIVTAYLSRISSEEKVMFVLATDARHPTCTDYMSVDRALEYSRGLAFGSEKSANIATAIYEAFAYAIAPAKNDPLFNTVFIVADPDLESNNENAHTLNECVQLRASSGRNFDVAVAIPYREKFLKDTNDTRRSALQAAFAKFEEFANQCAGRYIQIPQNDLGVDTDPLHLKISQWLYSTNYFLVDFSSLSGLIPREPQIQDVSVSISCGSSMRLVDVKLDTALLPEPVVVETLTPEATDTVPTPTPDPTPVVSPGQSDTVAMQAIHALNKLFYLERTNYKDFDNSCYLAYIDFCTNNGIDPRDGIYEETYNLLLSGKAIPAPTPTPTPRITPVPTSTPDPTIPPEGYVINDQDIPGSGEFIAQIQNVLKGLNCYDENSSANVGRMDKATIDAINKYCAAYGWENHYENGVNKEICTAILVNGPKQKPIEMTEPTAREKALDFLQQDIVIFGVNIQMWMPVVLCVVLVFIILIIVLFVMSGDKTKKEKEERRSVEVSNPETGLDVSSIWQNAVSETPTESPYFSLFVTLQISYAGHTREQQVDLRGGNTSCVIGRRTGNTVVLDASDKEVSRDHAELIYVDGSVYLRDLSTYRNTTINGMQVHTRGDSKGTIINNGDQIALGKHTIIVKW